MTTSDDHDLDLLIVGAGPAGLLSSIQASLLGLRHRVIERRRSLHKEPSAHVLKTHTMEVYRRVGVSEAIHSLGTPPHQQRYVTWCQTVSGPVYGRIDLKDKKGPIKRFLDVSPIYPANLPQTSLEPILLDRARALGGQVQFNCEFISLAQDRDGVNASLSLDDSGRTETVRAKFLIGADGASSRVRKSIGIEMDGPAALAHFIAIHFRSDVRPLFGEHPGILYFVVGPDATGTFIMHEPNGSQVFMMPYNAQVRDASDYGAAECERIVRAAFGSDHPFTILSIGRWTMSAQVAQRYREGRVFLVGDSAHRFPPTGGLGLNTGVEDVENLLWKIGAVIDGRADPALLNSYETECRPTALRNCQRSWTNAKRKDEVEEAIGVVQDPIEFDAALSKLFGPEGTLHRDRVEAAVKDQIEHFAYLETEMAATYAEGAFVPSAIACGSPVEAIEGYAPCLRPGAHLPHVWLEEEVSTLDLLAFDKFVLIASGTIAARWRAALQESHLGGLVNVAPVYLDVGSPHRWGDFLPEPGSVVLVRPDGRVAWIGPAASSVRDLEAAVEYMLAGGSAADAEFEAPAPVG